MLNFKAWLCPKDKTPEERCQYCGYYLQFLMQLYANSNDTSVSDYHRTLYVFTCLSPQCIGTQRSVLIKRSMIKHDNPHVQFADDELFEEVQNSYEQQLIERGLINLDEEEEEEQKEVPDKDKKLEFKEYMIINEPEDPEATQFYLKESQRIKNKQPKAKQEDDGDESDEDQLEDEFLKNQANANKDQRQIDKLVKKTLKAEEEDDENDYKHEGEEKDKIDDIEMKEFEKLIKNNHSNYLQIPDHYKLCEIVCKADPEQVIRYVNNRDSGVPEPLWMSDKNIIDQSKVNPCEKCGKPRSFEFQIMPQLFNFIGELVLVDWNTIVFYSCSNNACFPDFESGEWFTKEFSYIQFSDDFDKVQYGDDKQIEKQRQMKKQQEQAEQKSSGKEQVTAKEEQTEEQKSKSKKKKNKKNKEESKGGDQATREEVNKEVQNQLQDLMNDMSFK
ncbi:programmed cell death protein 2 [Stylonychia lemnae]|uniref:Programmed cell death protein 2 n=1 Tax=Stylonychia lemnae TaxID=5949 RepID=A0A078A785_STYLE|nr:programmed cell death protein 2 [Stylonychia lemnae]|eukprot:CDW77387.1 programmed cell death protein 2 [Stylonychia lemnae]